MKKLNLNLNQLAVESFEISETKLEKGTVKANAPGEGEHDNDFVKLSITCPTGACPGHTCFNTCDISCFDTCQSPCEAEHTLEQG